MSTSPSPSMNYLITGAAQGIGRALALRLHSQGHRIFLLDSNSSELTHTLGLLSAQHTPSHSTRSFDGKAIDISDTHALRGAMRDVSAFCSQKLDVLINNAMAMPHTLPPAADEGEASMAATDSDTVAEHWERQLAVGLSAPFHLSRMCVPLLRRDKWRDAVSTGKGTRPGCIVNVSSTRAAMAEVDHEGYSAVKAGLLGLSQSMSVSLGLRYGIRVNSVVLGWIDVSEQREEADRKGTKWGAELTQEDHAWHPAGRVGKGEDVLRAVQYLVGSEFVTGSEVTVDGGVTRRMVYPE